MIIRAARDKDRETIATLHTQSWQQSYRGVLPDDLLDGKLDEIMLERWRDQRVGHRDILLVAEEPDGEPIGFCATWVEERGYIDNLHVRPGWRSKGVGRALLGETARQLVSQGIGSAFLHVVASNVRARSFYLALGGVAGEIEDKNLYGTVVPNQRIDWPDVTVLAVSARHRSPLTGGLKAGEN